MYVYTPLPASSVPDSQRLRLAPLHDTHGDAGGVPAQRARVDRAALGGLLPATPMRRGSDERLRQRIRDFVTVLRCRFPTVQDTRAPRWAKSALRGLAAWRYSLRRYDRPWELQRLAEDDPPARSARLEHLNAMHCVQISFFLDREARARGGCWRNGIRCRRSPTRSPPPARVCPWCRPASTVNGFVTAMRTTTSCRRRQGRAWRPARNSRRCSMSCAPMCCTCMASRLRMTCWRCAPWRRASRSCCRIMRIGCRGSGAGAG